MSTATKFTFDTHFGEAERNAGAAHARSRKSYSAEEIETLTRDAREEGLRDGSVLATQAQTQALAQLAAGVAAAIQAMDAEIDAMRAEAAGLAFAAAKKLADAALAATPVAEIEEALGAALHQAVGETRVVVKTAPALAHIIEARAADIAMREGYEGRIQFVGDGALAGADCRIEWRGGGIERSHAEIENALADLIARRFPRATENKE
jgi:flagellar assembly protein FliH